MAKNALLGARDSDKVEAIRIWFAGLLASHVLDALLVLLEEKDKAPAMALVSSPDRIKYANPFAPIIPGNAAGIVSRITRIARPRKSIGVVLRPCEIRALIELVKLKQGNLENVTIIGMDCTGTYSRANYGKAPKYDEAITVELRTACQVCEYPSSVNADLTVSTVGPEDTSNVFLMAHNNKGEELLRDSSLPEPATEDLAKRTKILMGIQNKHIEAKKSLFEILDKKIYGPENLTKALAACTGCHNCRIMCPICYCKECFFDSPTFDWEADKYLEWAREKGAMKMPSDTLLYHLTRLNHMAASCVGCGMCSEACPNEVPVFDIFHLVSSRVQDELGYIPGRDINEELPLSVFKEDEFQDIG